MIVGGRLNAVLAKELTTRMRGWRTAAVVTAYLGLLAAVSLLVLTSLQHSSSISSYANESGIGSALFATLSVTQFVQILFVTPASLSDAVAGERQRQTLDLLLVTRLSSTSIILGKLFAGLAFNVLLILCSIPLFSLVFLFGGVDLAQIETMFLVFLSTTFVLGALALCISTLVRRATVSTLLSLIGTAILTAGLAIVSLIAFSSSANGANGGVPTFPFAAYFDPLTGFIGALNIGNSSTGGLYSSSSSSALSFFNPIGLGLVGDQIATNILLGLVFLGLAIVALRPRTQPRRPASRPAAIGQAS